MLIAHIIEQWRDLRRCELSVGRADGEQLTTGEVLRRAALVNVDVRRRRTDDRVVRGGQCLQAQYVRARAAEDEEDARVCAEVRAE